MTRNRLFTLGCPAAILVIIALMAIIYFALRGPYEISRSRWSEKGSGDYTLTVMQYCYCSVSGEYRITVEEGQVTDFEILGSDQGPFGPTITIYTKPSDFQHLTVAYLLAQAERDQVDIWTSPFTRTIDVTYDPTYGYVTSFVSDPNGTLDDLMGTHLERGNYIYSARDLVIIEP